MSIQCIPLPGEFKRGDVVRDAFIKALAINYQGAKFEAVGDDDQMPSQYFKIQLPDGEQLLHMIPERDRFDVQFARYVLSQLLQCPEKMDWRASQDHEQEVVDAEELKEKFAVHDFTL